MNPAYVIILSAESSNLDTVYEHIVDYSFRKGVEQCNSLDILQTMCKRRGARCLMDLTCAVKVSWLSNSTPRSVVVEIRGKLTSWSEYWKKEKENGQFALRVACKTTLCFSPRSLSLFSLHQWANASMSFRKCRQSLKHRTSFKILMSSALSKQDQYFIAAETSLTNRESKRGPERIPAVLHFRHSIVIGLLAVNI